MKINKDLYLYLTQFVDDKTLLIMTSVNKKYFNLSTSIFSKKYPNLINNDVTRTEKHFYIIMMKYIHLLNKKYKIPYIPYKNFNPEKFYKQMNIIIKPWNLALFYAIKSNQLKLVKYMFNHGATDVDLAINTSSRKGYIEIVKYMCENFNVRLSFALGEAASNGHIEVVRYLMKKDDINLNWGLYCAAKGGHTEIIDLMIENGANAFNGAMYNAIISEDINIVKYMIKKGANDFNGGLFDASKIGNLKIVKLMIEHGADNFYPAIKISNEKYHFYIVDYLNKINNQLMDYK